MLRNIRPGRMVLLSAALLALGGCDLGVSHPTVIDADTFDPASDAAMLSYSAQTNFYSAFGASVIRGAYFSGELWVGEARQEANDFGRRVITPTNLDINSGIWFPLSLAISTNEKVREVLAEAPDAGSNLHLGRAAMNSGFGLVLMAEHFCEGVMLVGPAMTPVQTLDSAVVRFQQAIGVGGAASGAEAQKILHASRVGLARSYLQQGKYDLAAATAAEVPASFEATAVYVDDPSNRGLGNAVFSRSLSNLMVVPEAYRALNDPRITFLETGRKAQDGQLDLVIQTKYPGYDARIRLASGLEARYIVAEAKLMGSSDNAAALALIAERRAAGGQAPFAGGDREAVLAELMGQRARDFWLEGKHMGDYVRNAAATPFVPQAGTAYYKPSQGAFGDQACIPVPNEERQTNPNFN